ncbi:D-alanine--D-alanine ligase [Patescibacteria group bacterium]
MKKKLKVAVLMGGSSSEREISIISGREVVKNLDRNKYEIQPVVLPNSLGIINIPKDIDVAFIAMHGPYGEDGCIQGLLEMRGIKYTGSGVSASAIGMDKFMFRKIMVADGLLIPKYIVITKKDKNVDIKMKKLGNYPFFVKPNDQGSSVGVSIVKNKQDLKKAVKKAFVYSSKVLIDEYIKGTELTCGVVGNDNPEALPVIEIVPKNNFFDYESKYSEKGAEEIIPARIPRKVETETRDLAIRVFKSVEARGFARVDFILKEGKLYILEINTIPGLTPMSLIPKEAKAVGITYPKLLDKIIRYAIEKT